MPRSWRWHFYPRSPCGERQAITFDPPIKPAISIHALLAESDGGALSSCFAKIIFLSTLSLRRATLQLFLYYQDNKNFYPRSPCGERPPCCGWLEVIYYFYPRSPCGERQGVHFDNYNLHCISIHALLAESDGKSNKLAGLELVFLSTLSLRRATIISPHSAPNNGNFYPRSPCGERLLEQSASYNAYLISIHALLAESDRLPTALRTPHHIFLSTLSLRRAT